MVSFVLYQALSPVCASSLSIVALNGWTFFSLLPWNHSVKHGYKLWPQEISYQGSTQQECTHLIVLSSSYHASRCQTLHKKLVLLIFRCTVQQNDEFQPLLLQAQNFSKRSMKTLKTATNLVPIVTICDIRCGWRCTILILPFSPTLPCQTFPCKIFPCLPASFETQLYWSFSWLPRSTTKTSCSQWAAFFTGAHKLRKPWKDWREREGKAKKSMWEGRKSKDETSKESFERTAETVETAAEKIVLKERLQALSLSQRRSWLSLLKDMKMARILQQMTSTMHGCKYFIQQKVRLQFPASCTCMYKCTFQLQVHIVGVRVSEP